MENLYPCSFKCLKSVAVMVCVWLQPFFVLYFFYFSVVCYKQLVFQFLWLIFLDFVDSIFLLATHFQYIQPERLTFYCLRVFGIFFKLFYCCFGYKIKSRRRLLKTVAIFLNFVVKTALIGWFLVVSFVFSANHKAFVICTCVTHFALLLQKSCTPFSANQN